jgi:uncharacterized protein YbjT (DUF2867 family)
MISVFGATGSVGGKVAAELLESNIPVRMLIRSFKKAQPLVNEGAEAVEGNMFNVEDIRRAMERCDGAFLMTPMNRSSELLIEEEITIGKNYAEALTGSTIKHIVYMSVIALREHTGIPNFESKAQVEDALAATGIKCTFLRPAFFMENFFSQWRLIQQMGIISFPFPADIPIPMVATEDIAYAAVQSLISGGKEQEAYDIMGPKDYTMAEATQIISSIIDKPLRYVEASPDETREMMMKNGASKAAAENSITMFEKFKTMQFNQDRDKVYTDFNYDPADFETVIGPVAEALKAEAR